MELHYIFFSDNFPKFSLQLYQNNLIKSSVMKLSQLKNLWWIPILVATCSICKNRLVYRRCLSGYCEKYVQSTGLWSSILVKKTLWLDLPWARIWKTEFDWGVLLKAFYSLATSRTFFESLFNKFAGFFSKRWGSISRNVA